MSIEKISQEDYFNMLNEYGLNEEDVNRMINSKEFDKIAGEVIDEPSELYYKAPSKIDKQGVFAKIKIFNWIWFKRQKKIIARAVYKPLFFK